MSMFYDLTVDLSETMSLFYEMIVNTLNELYYIIFILTRGCRCDLPRCIVGYVSWCRGVNSNTSSVELSSE